MRDSRLTVRLAPELRKRLRNVARRNGQRESDLVRAAVERQLAAEDKMLSAYDDARTAGLIGAARGAVRDLSTSRKHFKGFGT